MAEPEAAQSEAAAAPEPEPLVSGSAQDGAASMERTPAASSATRPEESSSRHAASPPRGAPVASDGDPGATVTLGRLYREQGHHERAAEVFRTVLEREPGNEEARRELDVAGEGSASSDASERTLAERKREVLVAFRARIRQAVAAGV